MLRNFASRDGYSTGYNPFLSFFVDPEYRYKGVHSYVGVPTILASTAFAIARGLGVGRIYIHEDSDDYRFERGRYGIDENTGRYYHKTVSLLSPDRDFEINVTKLRFNAALQIVDRLTERGIVSRSVALAYLLRNKGFENYLNLRFDRNPAYSSTGTVDPFTTKEGVVSFAQLVERSFGSKSDIRVLEIGAGLNEDYYSSNPVVEGRKALITSEPWQLAQKLKEANLGHARIDVLDFWPPTINFIEAVKLREDSLTSKKYPDAYKIFANENSRMLMPILGDMFDPEKYLSQEKYHAILSLQTIGHFEGVKDLIPTLVLMLVSRLEDGGIIFTDSSAVAEAAKTLGIDGRFKIVTFKKEDDKLPLSSKFFL